MRGLRHIRIVRFALGDAKTLRLGPGKTQTGGLAGLLRHVTPAQPPTIPLYKDFTGHSQTVTPGSSRGFSGNAGKTRR
jgi:hypothetical protein